MIIIMTLFQCQTSSWPVIGLLIGDTILRGKSTIIFRIYSDNIFRLQ